MTFLIHMAVYGVVLLCMVFLTDAVVGFLRAARGYDEDIIKRRLSRAPQMVQTASGESVPLLRQDTGQGQGWMRFLPAEGWLQRLVMQSGTTISVKRLTTIMASVGATVLILLLIVLPNAYALLAFFFAILAALSPVMYLAHLRAKRMRKFEEQLPDALDLIVRGLKIGHPLNGAMAVIAEEMRPPIGTEFRIAFDAVSYGEDIGTALTNMSERIPVADLGYLIVAVQIQQETGGNLAETLSKLSAIIRERFRMFRKVKAMTAEGRFSAWLLSAFPFGIGACIELLRPGYYAEVADFQYFPHLVILTVVLLVLNIFVMRFLTTIKV